SRIEKEACAKLSYHEHALLVDVNPRNTTNRGVFFAFLLHTSLQSSLIQRQYSKLAKKNPACGTHTQARSCGTVWELPKLMSVLSGTITPTEKVTTGSSGA